MVTALKNYVERNVVRKCVFSRVLWKQFQQIVLSHHSVPKQKALKQWIPIRLTRPIRLFPNAAAEFLVYTPHLKLFSIWLINDLPRTIGT